MCLKKMGFVRVTTNTTIYSSLRSLLFVFYSFGYSIIYIIIILSRLFFGLKLVRFLSLEVNHIHSVLTPVNFYRRGQIIYNVVKIMWYRNIHSLTVWFHRNIYLRLSERIWQKNIFECIYIRIYANLQKKLFRATFVRDINLFIVFRN